MISGWQRYRALCAQTTSGYKTYLDLYVIRCGKRQQLAEYLFEKGIETSVHYPTALPNLPAYKYLGHKPADFPVATELQDQILSLPLYPEMTEEMIAHVADSIRSFFCIPFSKSQFNGCEFSFQKSYPDPHAPVLGKYDAGKTSLCDRIGETGK